MPTTAPPASTRPTVFALVSCTYGCGLAFHSFLISAFHAESVFPFNCLLQPATATARTPTALPAPTGPPSMMANATSLSATLSLVLVITANSPAPALTVISVPRASTPRRRPALVCAYTTLSITTVSCDSPFLFHLPFFRLLVQRICHNQWLRCQRCLHWLPFGRHRQPLRDLPCWPALRCW